MAATMLRKFGTLTRAKRPKSDLWVRIKGQKMKNPYHCVWPPFCESRPDIDWASLTTYEVTYPHVRLYELSGEDSLTMFVSFLEQLTSIPTTRAIILINTEESYDLDAKFSTTHNDTPVPVVVVKRKTGEALLKQAERYARNVEASIEGEKEGKLEVGGKGKEKGKTKKAPEEKVFVTSQSGAVTLPPQVKDGSIHDLHVRVRKDGGYQRHSFKFSLGSLPQSLPSIGWVDLTASETTFPHVRIHELREEDSLTYFVATLSSIPAARAMILINPKSTYELSMKFRSSEESPPVPLLLVTRETGTELLNLVGEWPRAVEVRVGMSDASRPQSLEMEKRESLFAGPESTQRPEPTAEPSPTLPVVVKNGLKIRIKSEAASSCRGFDYVAASFSTSLRSISWADLTTGETTYPHIRLHELNDEDSLSFFMSTMASVTATMAVVLINSENNFTLSQKIQSEEQSSPVPVLVVTKETGEELLRLSRENFREVEAMVELSLDKKTQPSSSPSSQLSWAVSPRSQSPAFPYRVPSLVKKGLKVRLKLSSSPLQYDFDYMSAPFSLSLRMVNWVDLTANEATYPHIRLHELKEDDSLSSFMSMLASIPATLAVVLINTQDSYDLSKKFNSEEQGSPVPMLVVTKEAGQELLRLVQENTRAIEASVDLSSGAKSYSSPALSSPSPLVSPRSTFQRGTHHTVKKGLHVKVTDETIPHTREFDYSWAAFNQSARAMDWIALTTSETTYQHIRLHQLKKDDSLSYFMATLSSIPAARAMILINSENSLLLSERLNSEELSAPVPVLVVTRETGAELLRLVGEHPRAVEVKVEVSAAAVTGALSTQSSWSDIGRLEIHLGNMSQSYRFDYSWGSFNQSVCPFQKMPLTLYEATFVHIRLHKLTQDDSLKLFMSMMASIPATMAIVLINFDNSYRLSEKFLSEEQSSPVPVILVTNETGLELLKLLHENPRDVEATIHSQPPMIKEVEPPHSSTVTPVPEEEGVKGLHVKTGLLGAVAVFDYAPGPFHQEVGDIDWICLTSAETTYPHIRIHDLRQEDGLSFFMSTMASTPAALAVIFVNSENNFRLSEKYQSEEQTPPVPVLVVTRETGNELLRLLAENAREVFVKVDQLSLQDVLEKNGLQIRLSNKRALQPTCFDYKWAKFNRVPRTIDWRPLARQEVTFPHIRLHQLHDKDNLGDFFSMMHSIPATIAIVLVNMEDSYQLLEKFESEGQSLPAPVLVVSAETGKKLLKMMEQNPREVEARVETALKFLVTPNVSSPTSPNQSLKLSIGGDETYSTGLVKRGIEVRLPTEETRYFDYAWSPFCDSPQQLDWMGLARHQVMYPHIQMHELKHSESITFFLSTVGSMASAKALILVNVYDGFEVDEKFHPQNEGPCIPTLVVPRKTGEQLFEFVSMYGREVEVRVHCTDVGEDGERQEVSREDEWDVIQSPLAEDIPSFSSLVESITTYTAITDGLLVKFTKGKQEKTIKFDYVWAPFCYARQQIDWTKLVLSTALPKNTSGYICVHDLRRDKTTSLYSALLQSPDMRALVLVNTCNSYKIPREFHTHTSMSVLVITKSTGEALTTVMRDPIEAKVEFGGHDRQLEWLPAVDASKPGMKLEWEDSCIMSHSMRTEEPKEHQQTTNEGSTSDKGGGEDSVKEIVQVQVEATVLDVIRPVGVTDETKQVTEEPAERISEQQSSTELGTSEVEMAELGRSRARGEKTELGRSRERRERTEPGRNREREKTELGRSRERQKTEHGRNREREGEKTEHGRSRAKTEHGRSRAREGEKTEHGRSRAKTEHGRSRAREGEKTEHGRCRERDGEHGRSTAREKTEHWRSRAREGEKTELGRSRAREGEKTEHGRSRAREGEKTEHGRSRAREGEKTEHGRSTAREKTEVGRSRAREGEKTEHGRSTAREKTEQGRSRARGEKSELGRSKEREEEKRELGRSGMREGEKTESQTREGELRRNQTRGGSELGSSGTRGETAELGRYGARHTKGAEPEGRDRGRAEVNSEHKPQSAPDKTIGTSTSPKTPELEAEFLAVQVPDTAARQRTAKDTWRVLESHTPQGATPPGRLVSLCDTPTMLPPQEMVPYNPEPFTGDVMGANHLNDVSHSGCVTEPGEHIAELPNSSSDIDWRKPIKNGLQIRPVEHQQSTPQYFTYRWSRVTDSAQKLDWITITEQDNCPEEHIHLHQLTKSTDLQLLMATVDDSSAAVLLLVNYKNSYEIDGKFFPPGEVGWPVPVMVVTADAGKKIKSFLGSHQCGVEALVDIEPQQHVSAPGTPRGRMSSFLKGLIGGNTD